MNKYRIISNDTVIIITAKDHYYKDFYLIKDIEHFEMCFGMPRKDVDNFLLTNGMRLSNGKFISYKELKKEGTINIETMKGR